MSSTKLLRVAQMDALYLNDELNKIFLKLAQDCLQCLPPGTAAKYQKEINLFIKSLLLYSSLFNHDCLFGQKMLLIKYENLTPLKKLLYLFTNSLEYIKNKVEELGRKHVVYRYTINADLLLRILSFINLCLFIRTGKYPNLVDRVLSLKQSYAKDFVHRQFGSKYLTRELLWSGFIEILVYILPIVNYHKVKRIVRGFYPFHKIPTEREPLNVEFTVLTRCAYCEEIPSLPHHMGCSHVFCYICLKANLEADSQFECPICRHKNLEAVCERVLR